MNTSDILNKAADLIQQRGWRRGGGGWNIPGQGLCLEGGIMAAVGISLPSSMPTLWKCPAYTAVTRYLELPDVDPVNGPGEASAWSWNDEQDRTAAEVIEVLRACAVIEASRERQTAEVS